MNNELKSDEKPSKDNTLFVVDILYKNGVRQSILVKDFESRGTQISWKLPLYAIIRKYSEKMNIRFPTKILSLTNGSFENIIAMYQMEVIPMDKEDMDIQTLQQFE